MGTDDSYTETEAAKRRDAIIRNMIATPPKKHAPLKGKLKKKASRSKGRSKKS
jgi:hypothetical protein